MGLSPTKSIGHLVNVCYRARRIECCIQRLFNIDSVPQEMEMHTNFYTTAPAASSGITSTLIEHNHRTLVAPSCLDVSSLTPRKAGTSLTTGSMF